jgi:hypothetical protein
MRPSAPRRPAVVVAALVAALALPAGAAAAEDRATALTI